MLTFHGLAVDRRMAGVLDVRIGSDGVLNCGHVGLGGCGTVGVDLYALSLGVEEFDEIGEHVGSNVLRASKAYEVIRLFYGDAGDAGVYGEWAFRCGDS